jgi:hypothetical protein
MIWDDGPWTALLRENHSGMETDQMTTVFRQRSQLRENHSGMLGTWRVEHGELRERTRVRFAHENSLFGLVLSMFF